MKPKITLEEIITKEEEFLVKKKLSSDANIIKITQRVLESTGDEKIRLETLLKLHTDYRNSLNDYNVNERSTEKFKYLSK
jgi:hypothetical protein